MLDLRTLVATRVSEGEAHRVIKVWRALWKKMAVFGYCEADRDPSLVFVNSAPQPRQALWTEGEASGLSNVHGGRATVGWPHCSPWPGTASSRLSMRGGYVRRISAPTAWASGLMLRAPRPAAGAMATLSRRTQRMLAHI